MLRLNKDEIARRAYLAGLVDGEAYIGVTRRAPKRGNSERSPRYTVRLALSMTDRAPVAILAEFAGMAGSVTTRRVRAAHHKTPFEFNVTNHRCVDLLKKLLPFLICKKQQAVWAIEFFDLAKTSASRRNKRGVAYIWKAGKNTGKKYHPRSLDDDFVRELDCFYRKMLRRK